jgi:hypothetical protein
MSGFLAFDEGGVPLVHSLFRQIEPMGDLAPRPPELAGAAHLFEFELTGDLAQLGGRGQPDRGVDMRSLLPDFRDVSHIVKIP